MLYARQGEGQMPNVMADKLIPNMTTASEMFEQMGAGLRTLSRGKKDVAGYDPMDDPNYEPTDAKIAAWEASQAAADDQGDFAALRHPRRCARLRHRDVWAKCGNYPDDRSGGGLHRPIQP